MIADTVAPAGQPGLLADVAFAERAAGMSTITVHDDDSSLVPRRKGTCTGSLVKNGGATIAPPVTPWLDARNRSAAIGALRAHDDLICRARSSAFAPAAETPHSRARAQPCPPKCCRRGPPPALQWRGAAYWPSGPTTTSRRPPRRV